MKKERKPKEVKIFSSKQVNAELIAEYFEKIGPLLEDEEGNLSINLALLGTVNPTFGAARTVDLMLHGKDQNADNAMVLKNAIESQTEAFMTDEQTAAAEMLYSQVIVLNATFNRYLQIASVLMDSELVARYFDMALKAQESCRKTIQTLHDIKNPKPRSIFIRNAIAQQVNELTHIPQVADLFLELRL